MSRSSPNTYQILLFYSNYSQESQATRIAIREILNAQSITGSRKFNLQEIDYDINKDRIQKFEVSGTPTLLVVSNGEVLARFFGEKNKSEIEKILYEILQD